MDRHVKYGVVLAALVAALAFALDAQASISTGGPPDYYLLTNMANWQANGAVDQQDKVWAIGSSTLAPPVGGGPGSLADVATAFGLYMAGGDDNHTLTLSNNGGPNLVGNGSTATLCYNISVAPGSPLLIDSATLDADVDGSPTTSGEDYAWWVKKMFYNAAIGDTDAGLLGTLEVDSTDAATDTATFPGVQSINVVETWYTDADSVIVNTTNTWIENGTTPVIPEPASIAVWSLLGGIGIAVVGLRRRRPAA